MKPLTITDLEGKVIEVTDVDEAINNADIFRQTDIEYLVKECPQVYTRELLNKRVAYWQDMYDKLIQLKNNQQ